MPALVKFIPLLDYSSSALVFLLSLPSPTLPFYSYIFKIDLILISSHLKLFLEGSLGGSAVEFQLRSFTFGSWDPAQSLSLCSAGRPFEYSLPLPYTPPHTLSNTNSLKRDEK